MTQRYATLRHWLDIRRVSASELYGASREIGSPVAGISMAGTWSAPECMYFAIQRRIA